MKYLLHSGKQDLLQFILYRLRHPYYVCDPSPKKMQSHLYTQNKEINKTVEKENSLRT